MKKIMIKPGIEADVEVKNGSIVIKATPGEVLEVSDKAFQIAIASDAFVDADTVPATKKGRKAVDREMIDDVPPTE
jgi:hypothetical protein